MSETQLSRAPAHPSALCTDTSNHGGVSPPAIIAAGGLWDVPRSRWFARDRPKVEKEKHCGEQVDPEVVGDGERHARCLLRATRQCRDHNSVIRDTGAQ
eukprot:COSAG01_NODE_5124_length_4470_cov_10.204987_5_plen_99_part_00